MMNRGEKAEPSFWYPEELQMDPAEPPRRRRLWWVIWGLAAVGAGIVWFPVP